MKRLLPISKLVIHHSVTPRDFDFNRTIQSINRNHALRLHPEMNGLGLHIAYHYCIGGSGETKQTRPDNEAGWHASNLLVNHASLGICLFGNFDKEEPSTQQLAELVKLVDFLKKQYSIQGKQVYGHREFAQKTCPGTNFSDKLLQDIGYGLYEPVNENSQPSDWAKPAWDIATVKGLVHGNPQGDLTIPDLEIILQRLGGINQLDGKLSRERLITALHRLNLF